MEFKLSIFVNKIFKLTVWLRTVREQNFKQNSKIQSSSWKQEYVHHCSTPLQLLVTKILQGGFLKKDTQINEEFLRNKI